MNTNKVRSNVEKAVSLTIVFFVLLCTLFTAWDFSPKAHADAERLYNGMTRYAVCNSALSFAASPKLYKGSNPHPMCVPTASAVSFALDTTLAHADRDIDAAITMPAIQSTESVAPTTTPTTTDIPIVVVPPVVVVTPHVVVPPVVVVPPDTQDNNNKHCNKGEGNGGEGCDPGNNPDKGNDDEDSHTPKEDHGHNNH